MTNSNILILVVAVIYTGVALYKLKEGDVGMGICFIGYVIGNIGLIIASNP